MRNIIAALILISSFALISAEEVIKETDVCKCIFIKKNGSSYLVEIAVNEGIEFVEEPAVGLHVENGDKILLVAMLSPQMIDGRAFCSFHIDKEILLGSKMSLYFSKSNENYVLHITASEGDDGALSPKYQLKRSE